MRLIDEQVQAAARAQALDLRYPLTRDDFNPACLQLAALWERIFDSRPAACMLRSDCDAHLGAASRPDETSRAHGIVRPMSDFVKAILLGIVEGITEFLPISSTGHMILVGHWLEFPQPLAKTFDIFIQLGAILAVVFYFRARLRGLMASFQPRSALSHPAGLVMVAFIPAAAIGFLVHHAIEEHLERPVVVAGALVAGAVAIELVERKFRTPQTFSLETVTLRQAVIIGFAQCLALIPGVSRSAATIMGGLVAGLSLPVSAEFSFFLAMPTMAAASGYSLLKAIHTLSASDATLLATGFVVAMGVAWVVVAVFMRFIQTHSFRVFSIYRVLLGAAVLAFEFWR
ncbi:MAG: undecaprenyl-diphosphate phosphatase [Candidatus Wallbacteria bacterium]|nr:undecaprenyl-diphosphate phosphatase [Candidatus Wallbacteria bacterium]